MKPFKRINEMFSTLYFDIIMLRQLGFVFFVCFFCSANLAPVTCFGAF